MKWTGFVCLCMETICGTLQILTYIDPVCPDRLTLRYSNCNTYLLHRRAELKAATGSTWLMRNWTLGNNDPLAVPTCKYIFLETYLAVFKTSENNWTLFKMADCFVFRILSMSVFCTMHHQSVIPYCLYKWMQVILLCLI